MKKVIVIGLVIIAVFYILKQMVYKPYISQKEMNGKEHKLRLGSFIFIRQLGSNNEEEYLVYKVIHINGDYVRLSEIKQVPQENVRLESDFNTYEKLKLSNKSFTITGILHDDLYQGIGNSFAIPNHLLKKNPNSKKTSYYYEDIPEQEKNKPFTTNAGDFDLIFRPVYSKEQIIDNGVLMPWILDAKRNNEPLLYEDISQEIELILN
ncbi:hypothetical protein FNW52_11500 [Flavobacterium sp. ZT3R18]|uniref:hypothetical protein n=1 Tax=Flavobacterium sp. ZT3R18 TaxID=2594429 RepID=UPI00117BA586|nr:hypothetical protein [Flavobacterium sp. ZT3R18]TRX35338.1 hypothetical protein FNW52_11500 [Flavobacterium sp. ZT3R18]